MSSMELPTVGGNLTHGGKTTVMADHRNIHEFTIHTGTMACHEAGTHTRTRAHTLPIIICPPFAYFR